MSGIEVAGLVLGALPILFAAVDFSKDGYSRAGIAFRKRKNVEKLALAILLQQQTMKETVKSIVIASGCNEIWRLDEDPLGYLKDENVKDEVLDYLGENNNALFAGTLEQSYLIVQKIAKSVASLVPTYKDSPDDLLALITANRDVSVSGLELIPRFKLAISTNVLKESVKELDDTTSALDRFTRILLSNRRTAEEKPSNKALKLAKSFRHVRKFANNLSIALFQGWREGCHSEHEARMFLEDRVDMAPKILKQIGKDTATPILDFQLVLAADMNQGQTIWHEAVFRVFSEEPEKSPKPALASHVSGNSQVTFASIDVTPSSLESDIIAVVDICGALEQATNNKQDVTFVLRENRQMGTTTSNKRTIIRCQKPCIVTLKELLSISTMRNQGPVLPWKFRMLLALKLASNLLQLLQTGWLLGAWSKDKVYFEKQATSNGSLQLDLGRPFVCLPFDDEARKNPSLVEPKIALLELGILLLEIWHDMTLEMRFGTERTQGAGYYQRWAMAEEWLDDTDNPLPDLYERAVSQCIQRPVGEERSPDWDDIKFLSAFCRDVIDPLSKNCRQWR